MSFHFIKLLPTPDEIREQFPVPAELMRIKDERDKEIRDVITGKSNKFLVIIGPCSADNEDAVCDYVCRLSQLNEKVKDKLILIPRIYTNKPRTTGEGYKGIVHQPDPEQKPDFLAGLIAMRKMYPVIAKGEISFLETEEDKVLIYQRSLGEQQLIVLCNLDKKKQEVKINKEWSSYQILLENIGLSKIIFIGFLMFTLERI